MASVWRFLGGWQPTALPMVVELFAIEDPDWLIARLMLLRDEIH